MFDLNHLYVVKLLESFVHLMSTERLKPLLWLCTDICYDSSADLHTDTECEVHATRFRGKILEMDY